MTEEAKRFLNLKEDAQALREIEWTDCAMNPRVCTTMMHKAADLIESLSAELEQVKRERDAAVGDLNRSRTCRTCFRYGDGSFISKCCRNCLNHSNWQWRGVKEENDE